MKALAPRVRPLLDGGGVSATDIIMNLFVFFFIAFSLLATFEKQKEQESAPPPEERQQQILLPTSTREAPAVAADAIQVEMEPSLQLRVDGKPVDPTQLTEILKRRLGPQRGTVVVRAHKDLSLGATVTLMDRIWAAGPKSVALATLAGEAKP